MGCTLGFTSLGTSAEAIKLALGCADINGTTQIVPRKDLAQTDFSDVWWVGDKADGGFVAVQLKNALSTGGFSLQTTKNGKGQISVTLTGHVSISAQTVMPMVFYSTSGGGGATPSINLNTHFTNVEVGKTITLTADVVPEGTSVTWSSADDTIATVAGGVVTGVAEGDVIITAEIAVDGVEYTDTCTVVVIPESTGA